MRQQARSVVQLRNTRASAHLDSVLSAGPVVMGILNVTPDSFSDGGRFAALDEARLHAEEMVADGASIVDIGGESTRPGAECVSEDEELARVIPIIDAVRSVSDCLISVDTSKPAVMRAAVDAGAGMINDIQALRSPGATSTAADLDIPVCLMHMQGEPRTMQTSPEYDDVVSDVTAFLSARVAECVQGGVRRDHIVLDPGFGFGKSHAHNLRLLAELPQLVEMGFPVLVGLSRKSTLGEITGTPVAERLAASVSAAVIAVLKGASIVRAHDVKATADAIRVAQAVMEINNE